MNVIGDRNWVLLADAGKTFGTWNPEEIFSYIEEELYVVEAQEIYDFLKWMHETGRTMGHGNYENQFADFKAQRKARQEDAKIEAMLDRHLEYYPDPEMADAGVCSHCEQPTCICDEISGMEF